MNNRPDHVSVAVLGCGLKAVTTPTRMLKEVVPYRARRVMVTRRRGAPLEMVVCTLTREQYMSRYG